MNKGIFLLIILTSALLLIACQHNDYKKSAPLEKIEFYQPEKSQEEKVQIQQQIDIKIYDESLATHNPKRCEDIQDLQLSNLCINNLENKSNAIETKNDLQQKEDINRYDQAILSTDVNMCLEIIDSQLQTICKQNIFSTYSDKDQCTTLENEQLRNECVSM